MSIIFAVKRIRRRPIHEEDAPKYLADGWNIPDSDPAPAPADPEDAADDADECPAPAPWVLRGAPRAREAPGGPREGN